MTTRCTCGHEAKDHYGHGHTGMKLNDGRVCQYGARDHCSAFTPVSNISEPRMSLDLEAAPHWSDEVRVYEPFAEDEEPPDWPSRFVSENAFSSLRASHHLAVERVKTLEAPRASYEVFCWNCAERNVGVVCKRCDSRLDAEARVKELEDALQTELNSWESRLRFAKNAGPGFPTTEEFTAHAHIDRIRRALGVES